MNIQLEILKNSFFAVLYIFGIVFIVDIIVGYIYNTINQIKSKKKIKAFIGELTEETLKELLKDKENK